MNTPTPKERLKENIQHFDFLKYSIVLLPLITLAISSILILDLYKINERLSGITFFSFILSGLITAFNAMKLKRDSSDGIIGVTITLLITIVFAVILIFQLYGCIEEQANLNNIFDLQTIFIYGALVIFYIVILIFLMKRFIKANYGKE